MTGERERIGPEHVERYLHEHRREIEADLRAQTDATLAELARVHGRPAWAQPSTSVREDMARALELSRGQSYTPGPLAHLQIDLAGRWHQLAPLPAATPRRDVVERIDDALGDWEHGPDAARWVPPGVHLRPIGPRLPAHQGLVLTPEQLARVTAVATGVQESLQRFMVSAEQVFAELGENLRRLLERVDDASGYALAPPPLPTNPRERSLELRRRRNTGPPVPPPGARGPRMGR